MGFLSYLTTRPDFYITWVILVMFSICVHEFAHACIALQQGDSTAADAGHLTLNPMVQMGLVPIILLCVIGITWGAVPVSPGRMRHRCSPALVAAAGPGANAVLFVLFCLLGAAFGGDSGVSRELSGNYADLFYIGATLNAFLFAFNMIPVPILDGWNICACIIPAMERVNTEVRNGATFLVFMLFLFTDLVDGLFGFGATATAMTVAAMRALIG